MKNMNIDERFAVARNKYDSLIDMVFSMKQGDDVNINHLRQLIHDIYKDELILINLLSEYEVKMESRKINGPEVIRITK